jgi:hypothetical protein
MPSPTEDPFERSARRYDARAAGFRIISLTADAPELEATLRSWDWIARSLLSSGVSAPARLRLDDLRRILAELERVLHGEEDGEGTRDARLVRAAVARGHLQALTTVFLCRRAAFIELLASAPWNLLGPQGPDGRTDARAVHGAGCALIAEASALARQAGAGGRVALQAENPRSEALYQRLGFAPMRPSDAPLALVPRGGKGWSPPVLRLARGEPGPDERRMPWLIRDPERMRLRERVHRRAG